MAKVEVHGSIQTWEETSEIEYEEPVATILRQDPPCCETPLPSPNETIPSPDGAQALSLLSLTFLLLALGFMVFIKD